jgi:hypothetical protein
MTIKMEALRTFAGAEGFFRRGQSFEVRDGKRATTLSEAGLAKMLGDQDIKLEDQHVEETIQENAPPPQGEIWGVKSLGGGWYQLPSGENLQGFDQAKRKLFDDLLRELEEAEPVYGSEYLPPRQEDEVRLIEPVTEPTIVFTDGTQSETVAASEEDPPRFEDDVRYLGGGWYELPNGERVQGKESARDVYEAYLNEGRNS